MKISILVIAVTLSSFSMLGSTGSTFQDPQMYNWDSNLLNGFRPVLIMQAYDTGLLSWSEFVPHVLANPYYLRGDFNGDGENDVAFYARRPSSDYWTLIIVHSTLDTAWVFDSEKREFAGEYMRVLLKGTVVRELIMDASGYRYGDPFELQNEAVEVHYFAKSSGIWLWDDGRYRFIARSD